MRKALVVGIDNYPQAPLSGCVNDANAIADMLSTHANNSPNFDCQRFTDQGQTISKASLMQKIESLFAYKADIALFYFSGHGTANNLGGYLVTPDARKYNEGVAMSDLLTFANNSAVQEVVIILDCCNSGAFGILPAINNSAVALREGISVLTASRADQPAKEAGGNGLFTKAVCAALSGEAANVIGNVTVASVYAYVDQTLGAWDQRPLLKSHVARLLPLRVCVPSVELDILRFVVDYFPTREFIFPLDPTYEPDKRALSRADKEKYPKNPEHEAIFAHLQKYRAAGLLVPDGAEHLYFAAMRSKACKLTPLGQFYWDLVKGHKL